MKKIVIALFILLCTSVLAVIALPQIFGYLRDKQERQNLRKRVEQNDCAITENSSRVALRE